MQAATRPARFLFGMSLAGALVTGYAAWGASQAWMRFGPSGTAAVFLITASLLAGITFAYGALGWLFARRLISSLEPVSGYGFRIEVVSQPGVAVSAGSVRRICPAWYQPIDGGAQRYHVVRAGGLYCVAPTALLERVPHRDAA